MVDVTPRTCIACRISHKLVANLSEAVNGKSGELMEPS